MGLTSLIQDQWTGGMYRGRRAPDASAYDAVNALVDGAEGTLFRRGGSAYYSTSDAAATLVGLAAAYLGDDMVIGWTTGRTYLLNSDGTITSLSTTAVPVSFARGVAAGTKLYLPKRNDTIGEVVAIVGPSGFPAASSVDLSADAGPIEYLTVAGQRLVFTQGSKVFFSARNAPETVSASDYHQIPTGLRILGADAYQDNALIFTTGGVFLIQNMSLDAVDDFGNIEQTVGNIAPGLVLWGDPGICGLGGAFIVPALDDIVIFTLDGAHQPITGGRGSQYDGGIRALYRSYVKAGYQPGTAAVHRDHYILPILNGSTLVDVLVCNMSAGFAWTRWAGHAASTAHAVQIGSATRAPKLYGVNGLRATNLTSVFDPTSANALEADGTTSDCVITTRDYPAGQNQYGLVHRARLRYELVASSSSPTVAVAYSSDADAGSFTTLTSKGEQGGAAGGGVSDGSKYNWWLVGKRRERIRFRVTVTGACASFVLRSIELLLRPTGRQ